MLKIDVNLEDMPWWHSIELPDGRVTPGRKSLNALKLEEGAVFDPIDVRGKAVLDVGAWDGYFSFAAERRGARTVTAADYNSWVGATAVGSIDCFQTAKSLLNSKVKSWVTTADAVPDAFEDLSIRFDWILLLGVIYHVKNPVKLLERMRRTAQIGVVVETHFVDDGRDEPMLYLYPRDELGNDPSNWTAPNEAAMTALASMAGFSSCTVSRSPAAPSSRLFAHCLV